MKIVRTILWVLSAFAFVIFAAYNWHPVELTLWQNLVLETKVPMLALLAFAAGFLPMWLVHRSVAWGMNRRIRTLEASLKNAALAHRTGSGGAAATAVTVADRPVDNLGKNAGEHGGPSSPAVDGGRTGGGSDGDGGEGGGNR